METFSDGSLPAILGVVGAVVLVAALLSGLLERSRLPQILIFLALGTALGPGGVGIIELGLDSPTLRVLATLGLVLVLFTDAVSVTPSELRRQARLSAIILGPGTLLTATVTALAAAWLLRLGPAHSTILGAALASTDPVLLRGLLRNPSTPESARQALRIESGMNDAVLLPVVLVAMSFLLLPTGGEEAGWVRVALEVLLIGGGAGMVVALLSVGALDFVRRRLGVRRDYESLYVLGVALTAFAVAEALHGSGFIAAFAAGITIAALDVEMCECFFDYGEATAEMTLLITFVALGSSVIWRGLDVVSPATLAFAAVALFARGVILLPALLVSGLDRRSRLVTMWFGPRGLSSLLLVLLPVFAGVAGAERLFEVTALVVLLSVVIHGGSQILLREPGRSRQPATGPAPAPRRAAVPEPAAAAPTADAVRITQAELDELRRRGEDVRLLDVRTETSYQSSGEMAAAAVRVPPERAARTVRELAPPPDAWLVAYCT